MDKLLKIKFEGRDMSPTTVSSNEFANIIAAYEDALNALIIKNNPTKGLLTFISVIEVQNNSETIIFNPNYEDIILEAADEINIAISKKRHNSLPFETVKNLAVIQRFVRERDCKASLNGYDGITSAEITPDTNLDIDESFYFYGDTTIYGILERLGGTKPKARIRLRNNKLLSVEISRSDAKELSKYIYEKVGFKGKAKWKKESREIESFKLKKLILMSNKPLNEKMKGLGDIFGKYWVDVEDPDAHAADLRMK
jgi:hypothetical protein